jgi:hypothetical protein
MLQQQGDASAVALGAADASICQSGLELLATTLATEEIELSGH